MHIRTIYYKVTDIEPARAFWSRFLSMEPHKDFDDWCEFRVGDVRLALLRLTSFEAGAGCVPVFELPSLEALREQADKALASGAKVFLDNYNDPHAPSVVLLDSAGNEFELTSFHD